MKIIQLIVLIAATTLIVSCGKLEDLLGKIDTINKTVGKAAKDATDVGLISEMGWISKLLRDSAQGTPEEQQKARETIARLFSIPISELSDNVFFEVTIKISDFTLQADQKLEVGVKYLLSDDPNDVEAVFKNSPGNAWQPHSVRSPLEFRRNQQMIRELVLKRITDLIPAPKCITQKVGMLTAASLDVTGCEISFTATWSSMNGGSGVGGANEMRVKFIQQISDAIMTPMEIAGLPPEGTPDGQIHLPWGLTSGATPYVVVFVPRSQVAENPQIKIHAWLHLKDHPEKILGAKIEIPATDFAERCLEKIKYKNPNPLIDSKTSLGPLCWFPFDLFGGGPRSQLIQLGREAQLIKDSN